jgi:succinylglutamate desuccinylase
MTTFDLHHSYPPELPTISIKNIHQLFPRTTLLHLPGSNPKLPALFIGTLIHGNESTSFYVLQKLLQDYEKEKFSRDLVILIGNPQAAALGLRQLPQGADYNRLWNEQFFHEHVFIKDVTDYLKSLNLYCAVDIHNNSGKNPPYSCLSDRQSETLHLASLFGTRMIFFDGSIGTLSAYLSKKCPAITIECGRGDYPHALTYLDFAYRGIKKILSTDCKLDPRFNADHLNMKTILASVHPVSHCDFDFSGSENSDLTLSFLSTLEEFNFETIPASTILGFSKIQNPLIIKNFHPHINHENDFFEVRDGRLITKIPLLFCMLHTHKDIAQSDCLGYLLI